MGASGTWGSARCPAPAREAGGGGGPRGSSGRSSLVGAARPVGGASAGPAAMPEPWTPWAKDEDFAKDVKVEVWGVLEAKVLRMVVGRRVRSCFGGLAHLTPG